MSIQLEDRLIRYPRGVLEDVLVKVDNLIFPVDFLVLEIEEALIPRHDFLLILRRPFMMTMRANVNIHEVTLTMSLNEVTVKLNILDVVKYRHDPSACFAIDIIGKEKCEEVRDS